MNSTLNDPIIPYIKKKGVGKTMSKSLTRDDGQDIIHIFAKKESHLTSITTFLTALMMLPNTDDEIQLLHTLQNTYWPTELAFLLSETPQNKLESQCLALIKGQDSSKTEAKEIYNVLFSPTKPEHLKALLLEGLRLKGETPEENNAAYDHLWAHTQRHIIDIPILIDLCYPYDGFNRHPNLGPFLATLLGSLGYPTLIHGTMRQGPKYGITHANLLIEAQKNHLQTLVPLEKDLRDPKCGWAYYDCEHFLPELYQLQTLRSRMVKRPVLATVEKHLQPIQSKHKNNVIAGYTHPPYKEKMIQILRHEKRCQSFLLSRGTEGSPQLQSDRQSPYFYDDGKTLQHDYISPEPYGLKTKKIIPNTAITAKENLEYGLTALTQPQSEIAQSLIFSAFSILKWHEPENTLIKRITDNIESGKALTHWKKGMNHA